VSDEDGAKIADTLGWNQPSKPEPAPATRLFQRKVTRLIEQEESALGIPGHTVCVISCVVVELNLRSILWTFHLTVKLMTSRAFQINLPDL